MSKNLLVKIKEIPPGIAKALLGLVIFTLAFSIYLRTVFPTVGFGDSGDFITAAYQLGLPHPTGYPLFTILGKLFTLIPIGGIAYRVNLVSVFFAAITVVLIYLIVEKITSEKFVGLFAGLLAAFSALFWSQAIQAEVYALHLFFICFLILLALNLEKKEKNGGQTEPRIEPKIFYLLTFTLGLSLTNHISMLLYFPAFAFFILDTDWKIIKNYKVMIFAILSFLLGLILYLYLPLRATVHMPRPWPDPTNIKNLIAYITASPYKGFLSYLQPEVAGIQAPNYLRLSLEQFPLYFLVLIPFGAWGLFKKDKRLFLFLLLLMVINVAFFINYHVPDIDVFFLPSFVILSIIMGLGVAEVISLINAKQWNTQKAIKYGLSGIFTLVLIIGILSTLLSNWSKLDRSDMWLAYDGAKAMLDTTKKGAIILFTGDFVFALEYMQEVEHIRPDVAILFPQDLGDPYYVAQAKKKYPNLSFPPVPKPGKVSDHDSSKKLDLFIRKNIKKHAIYTEGLLDLALLKKYGNIYQGLLFKISDEKTGAEVGAEQVKSPFRKIDFQNKQVEHDAWEVTSAIYSNRIKVYLLREEGEKALEICNEGLSVYPDSALLHRTKALILERKGQDDKAIGEYYRAIQLDPAYGNSYYGLGRVFFDMKRYDEAYDLFEKAIFYAMPIQRSDADLFYHQALLAESLGDKSKAIKYWETYIYLEPASPRRIAQAKRRLNELKRGSK